MSVRSPSERNSVESDVDALSLSEQDDLVKQVSSWSCLNENEKGKQVINK
jgi:hypothetical protein